MSADAVLPIAIPIAVLVLILLRNRRRRRLRLELMWITPMLVVVGVGMSVYFQPHPEPFGPMAYAGMLLAGIVGGVVGWWRGKAMALFVDPDTHELSAQASPVGLLLIAAILALRMGLRAYVGEGTALSGQGAAITTDALLLFAVGMVVAQRVEIWLRARRMVAEARGAASPAVV